MGGARWPRACAFRRGPRRTRLGHRRRCRQRPQLPPELLAHVAATSQQVPEEVLRGPDRFGPARRAPPGADETTSLMAWLGRDTAPPCVTSGYRSARWRYTKAPRGRMRTDPSSAPGSVQLPGSYGSSARALITREEGGPGCPPSGSRAGRRTIRTGHMCQQGGPSVASANGCRTPVPCYTALDSSDSGGGLRRRAGGCACRGVQSVLVALAVGRVSPGPDTVSVRLPRVLPR